MEQKKVSVVIPTRNAKATLPQLLKMLKQQTMAIEDVVIVDSSSEDDTPVIASSFMAKAKIIQKEKFDHGIARNDGGSMAAGDIIIYLTQDVLPANEYAVERLVNFFAKDPKIGAVYGRQLPAKDADVFAEHLRLFNYPEKSYIRSFDDRKEFGIKTIFLSDAFVAYDRAALDAIGWFAEGIIFGEDMYAAAKLILAGYKIGYTSDALVYHSHNYTIRQEFSRYFDIGVFHRKERAMLEKFGKAENEGMRYLISQLSFLAGRKKYHLMPFIFFRDAAKYLGYLAGKNFDKMPPWLSRKLSMNAYWFNLKEDV